MNNRFSIVIICKNEIEIIERVLQSLLSVSDDIVVYDTGSTDGTIELLMKYNVRLINGEWLGYGKTKQLAVQSATYDWVLSVDADEALDEQLQESLKSIQFESNTVYQISFKNFLGDKWLRFGEWGNDKHVRLFNKNEVNWNDALIHESLIIPGYMKVKKLPGFILHYTVKDLEEYSRKVLEYALLNAIKYHNNGRRASWLKLYISPLFTFTKHYFFQLGFLDGWQGLASAYMTAYYTFLKYARLRELTESSVIKPYH